MDITPYIDWERLAADSGETEEFLRSKINTYVSLRPATPWAGAETKPKRIQEMSVHERSVFLRPHVGKIIAVTDDLTIDRVCPKADGYVCFSSKRVVVAKTVAAKYDELDPLIPKARKELAEFGVPLDYRVMASLPRNIKTYRNPQYAELTVHGTGELADYPTSSPGEWAADALRWRRWSRVLGMDKAYPRWAAAVVQHEGEAYWALEVENSFDLLIITRLRKASQNSL